MEEFKPLNPWTGSPESLTPDQQQAVQPNFMAAHPGRAALNRYYSPVYGPQSFGAKMGEGIRNFAMKPNALGNILNNGPMSGAALGGTIGAGAGALLGARSGRSARLATLLGVLGAGVGAYSGYERTKAASFWRQGMGMGGEDARQELISALNMTPSLGFDQKMKAMAAIPGLSDSQASQLLAQVSTLGGIGAGAAIMRYLMGAGLMGTVFGGLVGGMMGNAFGHSHNRTGLGGPSMNGFDMSGNSLNL